MSGPEDSGIGDTPTFLFIVQFLFSFVMIGLIIVGQMHKPASILLCFPLLMSRMGRGAIIFMLALPVTNFLDAWTAIIAIIAASIGFFNMYLGYYDGPVELKYADEGVPEDLTGASKGAASGATPPQNRQKDYEMQSVPNESPSPAGPQTK